MAGPIDGDAADDEPDDIELEIVRTGLDLLLCLLLMLLQQQLPTITSATLDSIGDPIIDRTTPPTDGTVSASMTVQISPSTPAEVPPASRLVPPPSQPPAHDMASPASLLVPPASQPPAAALASPASRSVQPTLNWFRSPSTPLTLPTDVPLPPVPEAATSNQESATYKELYSIALERFKPRWQGRFAWLQLVKTSSGLPDFKCSVCLEHAGLTGKAGRGSQGAVDIQIQAFTLHAGTNKHKLAIQWQDALVGVTRQPRID
ncbi:unnamed protein product [Closterium sp. NIES-54]